ncbi:MAG: hypothetical protein KDN20_24000 [Verrucomicrobiae bacterium]|nr:hypothetical protein [Verrucomicrobiae bacterium]
MTPDSPGDNHDLRSDDDANRLRVRGPIPEELFSFYEERAFKSCTRCGEGLQDFPDGYRVSKVYRGEEVIFEYALCMPCLKSMFEESSEESKQSLMRFQAERFRFVTGFDECALCENTREGMTTQDYGLVGICLGDGLAESNLICGECMEAMSECVSEETRKGWDRFVDENFPGVPADFRPMPVRDPVSVM